ncbi:MAG: hypothetical protein U1E14_05440 [Geminicoccaceae bacterium]
MAAGLALLAIALVLSGTAGAVGLPPTYRIALTMDGNYNDQDDIGASPLAMALLRAFGASDRVVHVSYNNILGRAYRDPYMTREHERSVLLGADRFGIDRSVVFSASQDDGTINRTAVDQLRRQIDASGPDDPLFVYAAGPMEFLYRALAAAGDNRRYVTILSHSSWNNTYGALSCCGANASHPHDFRAILALRPAPRWVQVRNQRGLDSSRGLPNITVPASDPRWDPWRFLAAADSEGGNPDNRWLWRRMVEGVRRPDATDAGMIYFLFTGYGAVVPDLPATWPEGWDPGGADADHTLRGILMDGIVPPPRLRKLQRLEAELMRKQAYSWTSWSFTAGVSQQGSARQMGGNGDTADLWTRFDALHGRSGTYTARVRYLDEPGGACTYRLLADGRQIGPAWQAALDPRTATWLVHNITGVPLEFERSELRVQSTRPPRGGERCQVDYVELRLQ